MSVTNFGQNWPSSWTTDGTLSGVTVTNSGNSTSAAILNTAASPNEVLDTECDLEFAYGASSPTGVVTISILRQTQGGYQATTDPVYQFTLTPTVSVTNHVMFTVPGSEVGGFKVNVSNGSGFSLTSTTLYYRQSQGQIG